MFKNATMTSEAAARIADLATGAHLSACKEVKAAQRDPKMIVLEQMKNRLRRFREELQSCQWTKRQRELKRDIGELEKNIAAAQTDSTVRQVGYKERQAKRLGQVRKELRSRAS